MAHLVARKAQKCHKGERSPYCGRAKKGRLRAAARLKLRVEMQPFLASKAVIFGINLTGPHILVVNHVQEIIRQPNTEPIESTLETFRHEESTNTPPRMMAQKSQNMPMGHFRWMQM